MLSRLRLLKLPIWPRSSPWERAAVQLLPDHRQLFRQGFGQLRGLKGMIDPHPQVTVDEQLLPQQRHQIGKRPAEAGLQLQVLVAIVRKRLELEASLYQILQILSVTLFEKTPILRALQNSNSQSDLLDYSN